VHLAVVDPGVGTQRRPLIVAAGGQWFVGPDNGLLMPAAHRLGSARAYEITAPDIIRAGVSPTFHGRDIFAPAAARLARGAPPDALGGAVGECAGLDFGTGHQEGPALVGRIIYVDAFGNLVTNIPAELLSTGMAVRLAVGRRTANGATAGTYGDVSAGTVAAVRGSDGFVEVAVREGSARIRFDAACGSPVRIAPRPSGRPRR
jgi:S-adenosylmethionine hydrolase